MAGGELQPGALKGRHYEWPHRPPSAPRTGLGFSAGWAFSLDSRTFCLLPPPTSTYITPTLEPDGLGVNPDSATYVLSDLEQVTCPH